MLGYHARHKDNSAEIAFRFVTQNAFLFFNYKSLAALIQKIIGGVEPTKKWADINSNASLHHLLEYLCNCFSSTTQDNESDKEGGMISVLKVKLVGGRKKNGVPRLVQKAMHLTVK